MITLSALLVCTDEAAATVLRRVLEELSMQVETCPDFARAAMRLAQDRFDVVILESESSAEVLSLLRETRVSRQNDGTMAVVVASTQETNREMFSLGVNFVLYKPVAYHRALSSLRAARAVMRKEKRKSARAPVHAHAVIDYADAQQEKATLVNLAQEGMSVRIGKKIPSAGKIYFQFQLPGQSMAVRLSGQVIWQDWSGRAGVQFVDVPKTSRRLMQEFLDANLEQNGAGATQFPEVTVEMEEPLHTVMTVAEQVHGKHTVAHETQAAHEPIAAATSDSEDRRTQERYSCRLGAEVYRTGTAVPHHCCLSDLSAGGCYLEVPLPFPAGVSVEIVVRTQDMKLRLRGSVQASHPGYGMGVAFELAAKEERENVRKLTEFVAASVSSSKK
jgi:CheY-like chemotaxis protein